jgi:hypothetical protein
MAKDRTRRARMRGSALEDRRRIERAAELRRTMRAGRRFVRFTASSGVDATRFVGRDGGE